jgi:hypothetical protein
LAETAARTWDELKHVSDVLYDLVTNSGPTPERNALLQITASCRQLAAAIQNYATPAPKVPGTEAKPEMLPEAFHAWVQENFDAVNPTILALLEGAWLAGQAYGQTDPLP